MATKTRNYKRPVKARTTAKRRKTPAKKSGFSRQATGFLVPLFFIVCIVSCLGFLAFMGYRTVTASSFFDARSIEVEGVTRISHDDIEKIVKSQTERNGVWNSDLEAIRTEVEKMSYVKSAAVTRILPDGVQVRIDERIPQAVVRIRGGDYWVDDEGTILGAVNKNEMRPAFVLNGWDESKTERAEKDNRERVKIYQKMQAEWEDLEIAKRVDSVNISDLQDPQAIIQDSGNSVTIFLGKEDFGKRLQKGLEVITGKGNKIESLISHGSNVVARYRNS